MSSFFKDRSDLRLSARFIFQNIMSFVSSSSSSSLHHLTSFTSLRSTLNALFGEETMLAVVSSSSLSNPKKFLLELVLEESAKLFEGHTMTTNSNNNQKQQVRNPDLLPIPVDETLFVRISERIYGIMITQQQPNEKNQNSLSSSSSSVSQCFVDELLKTESKMHLDNDENNKKANRKLMNCISRETFLLCAASSPATSSLMSTSSTASMLWQNLVDCEKIILQQQQQSSANKTTKKCPFHHRQDHENDAGSKKRHVSFPFLKVDQNRAVASNDDDDDQNNTTCVSKDTILRCLNLGSRI